MELSIEGATFESEAYIKIEQTFAVYSDEECENEFAVKIERSSPLPSTDETVQLEQNVVWIKSAIPSNDCIKAEPLDDVTHTKSEIESNVASVEENPLDAVECFEKNCLDNVQYMSTEISYSNFDRCQQKVPPSKKELSCDLCGKVCFRKDNLVRHLQTHRRDKQFGCDECGLKFTLVQYLRRHQLNHRDEKRFYCDDCGRGFVKRNHLETHKQSHIGLKPFACDECGSKYSRKGALNVHKLSHTDFVRGTPYVCDVCERRFARKQYLERHKLTHSGERPFSCEDCGRRFSQPAHLKEHLVSHMSSEEREKRMLACDKCDRKFLRPYNLKKHSKICNKSK
ncbi:oocyte zinc finger protein XlCOF26-like [Bradysia coprophila]|uniref:oocyte zinc finger protein XlCOF26-like n=1 Tax=Bradysia coprophila TaxID=38358 RepID=UPI00187DB3CD|nr:oocyte zinc finger protein XlCOF26-like [Bradysia coprophila]